MAVRGKLPRGKAVNPGPPLRVPHVPCWTFGPRRLPSGEQWIWKSPQVCRLSTLCSQSGLSPPLRPQPQQPPLTLQPTLLSAAPSPCPVVLPSWSRALKAPGHWSLTPDSQAPFSDHRLFKGTPDLWSEAPWPSSWIRASAERVGLADPTGAGGAWLRFRAGAGWEMRRWRLPPRQGGLPVFHLPREVTPAAPSS